MFNWSSLFRSRWLALIWAAGICWSAAMFVPSDPPAGASSDNVQQDGSSSSADDAERIETLQRLVARLER